MSSRDSNNYKDAFARYAAAEYEYDRFIRASIVVRSTDAARSALLAQELSDAYVGWLEASKPYL